MSRAFLMPLAVLLAGGAVLLGPGEHPPSSPGVERVEQSQVQVNLVRSGN